VAGEETLFAGPADALALLPGRRKRAVLPGDSFEEAGARVLVLPAGDREDGFHPPSRCFGYLVEGAGPTLLHPGDPGTPAASLPRAPGVIALPVSGGTVLDAAGAAAVAARSGAAFALPLHWGDLQGGWADAARFRDEVRRLSPGMGVILREIGPRDR
jgi:L-ascorbate metabolism protein UlaG (beta-lactamase superfamily)